MAKKKTGLDIGDENEAEYEFIMQKDEGYITSRKGKALRWEKNKDLFNQFDIVGLRYDWIILVQVKTRPRNALADILRWIADNHKYLPTNISFRMAIRKSATKTLPVRWNITDIDRDGNIMD